MDEVQAETLTRLALDRPYDSGAVRTAGEWLAAAGVRAGDVIALCVPDSVELIIALHAAAWTGAIPATLSPLSPRRELYRRLCVSGARWLVTTSELFAQKLEAAARPTAVIETFVIGSAAGAQAAPRARWFDAAEGLVLVAQPPAEHLADVKGWPAEEPGQDLHSR
jgi:acyl-coenzyme A synthetase/AMP-(fatty) acid ligase